MSKEAIIIVTYGASGSGKTVDCLYSFPEAVWFCPAYNQTIMWSELTGVEPREILVNDIVEVTKRLSATSRGEGKTVVLDDFSVLAERTLMHLEQTKTGYKIWKGLNGRVLALREVALEKGINVILNCHEQPPSTDVKSKEEIKGGPKMPSKNSSMTLPHLAALVLRTGSGDNLDDRYPPWAGEYFCTPSTSRWTMKDRFCVVPRSMPMNLREILVQARARGKRGNIYVPPRPRNIAWIEPYVEKVSTAFSRGATGAQVDHYLATELKGKDPRHMGWIHRDGLARHVLRTEGNVLSIYTNPDQGQSLV